MQTFLPYLLMLADFQADAMSEVVAIAISCCHFPPICAAVSLSTLFNGAFLRVRQNPLPSHS